MSNSGLYFAVVVIALIAALWLSLLIIGFFFKLLFLSAIVLLGVAAYRVWRSPTQR